MHGRLMGVTSDESHVTLLVVYQTAREHFLPLGCGGSVVTERRGILLTPQAEFVQSSEHRRDRASLRSGLPQLVPFSSRRFHGLPLLCHFLNLWSGPNFL